MRRPAEAPVSTTRVPILRRLVFAIPVTLIPLLAPPSDPARAAAGPYADGEIIEITGLVTDADGNPIPEVRLLLEASRRSFKVLKLRREKENLVRRTTRTDTGGEYTLEWKWHRYYNHFELSVVVGVKRPGGREHLEKLATVRLSDRIRRGSPVVASITVEDTTFLDTFRSFLASLRTADLRRVYDQMGKPDKVETVRFPEHRDESWWYFASGRTYRFRDGTLQEVVEFEPVTEF